MNNVKKYSARDLETKIDEYFKSITYDEEILEKKKVGTDEEGKPIYEMLPKLNNLGKPIVKTIYIEKPTVLGLCEYLNIHRDTLRAYEKEETKIVTIKKAREKIERYKQGMLYDAKNAAGIIFDLKNNHGWTDKPEVIDETQPINVWVNTMPKDSK